MKKAAIVLCVLLVLSLTAAGVLAVDLYGTGDEPVLTEDVLWGKSAATEGLSLQTFLYQGQHLQWDTAVTLPAVEEAKTHFAYTPTEYREGPAEMPAELRITNDPFARDWELHGDTTGINGAYQALFDSLGPDEEGEMTLLLADYLDYYPLRISLDFPGSLWYDSDFTARDNDQQAPFFEGMAQYFRIPVLPNDAVTITVGKRGGELGHFGNGPAEKSEDSYEFWPRSVQVGSDLYFIIEGTSRAGQPMDFSLLPEGFGIFRLPFREETLPSYVEPLLLPHAEELSMVYALDPALKIQAFTLGADQKSLLLFTLEEGLYRLRVIDMETWTQRQVLDLGTYDRAAEYTWLSVYDQKAFVVAELQSEDTCSRLTVLRPLEDGTYVQDFTCDILPPVDNPCPPEFSNAAFSYDGSRLAVASINDYRRNFDPVPPCTVILAVYTEDGPQYLGTLSTSLVAAEGPDEYEYEVHPRYPRLQLTWA